MAVAPTVVVGDRGVVVEVTGSAAAVVGTAGVVVDGDGVDVEGADPPGRVVEVLVTQVAAGRVVEVTDPVVGVDPDGETMVTASRSSTDAARRVSLMRTG